MGYTRAQLVMMPSFKGSCTGICCQVNRLLQNQRPGIPAWEDIKYITKDLANVLDNFVDDADAPIPTMRARLARTIAEMRDEKGIEDRMLKPAVIDPYTAIRNTTHDAMEKLRAIMLRR
ncbi:MAG: hypothetical protein Q6373_023770 [Candidatus Sigynarchaeota archaeon]